MKFQFLISKIIFILFYSVAIFAQDNTFYRKYNFGGMQGALQLATTLDGGFVATGQHEGNGSAGECDIYVYKLDVCGNIEWFNIYGTAAQEGGKSIQQTSSTNVGNAQKKRWRRRTTKTSLWVKPTWRNSSRSTPISYGK